jgi:transposase
MVVIGIDTHKRSQTAVAADEVGRKLGERTTGTNSPDHLDLMAWADRFGDERVWAIEDCRQMSRSLEHDLLTAGERVLRVPPKVMAHARDAARTRGKSDPIDALAVARVALREPDLPVAVLDGPEREVGLLVDHRDHLVAERTRVINRLRWHLHELDPDIDPPARSLIRIRQLKTVAAKLANNEHLVARLARDLVTRCRELTEQILELERELTKLVADLAPGLLGIYGCSTLTAAKRPRPATSMVGQSRTPPAQPPRQPPAQHRAAPHRHHPIPPRPRIPRLPAETHGQRYETRSDQSPEPPPVRRRLPHPAQRQQTQTRSRPAAS